MRLIRLLSIFALTLLLGCNTTMEAENAQKIKLEFTKGSGPVSGIIKASAPGMAGISSKNFDITAPGSFELMGGPSEYEIVFNPLTKEMKKGWTLSVDGVELKRGRDMIVEDDKGPRVSFKVGSKKSPDAEKSE